MVDDSGERVSAEERYEEAKQKRTQMDKQFIEDKKYNAKQYLEVACRAIDKGNLDIALTLLHFALHDLNAAIGKIRALDGPL